MNSGGPKRAYCFSGLGVLGGPPRQPSGLWAFGFDPRRPQCTGWAAWVAARAASFPSRAGRVRVGGNVVPSPRRVLPPSRGTESFLPSPPCGGRGPGGVVCSLSSMGGAGRAAHGMADRARWLRALLFAAFSVCACATELGGTRRCQTHAIRTSAGAMRVCSSLIEC